MPRPAARLCTPLLALIVAACGAGEPQNDATRMAALPAGWEASTQSAEARQFLADGTREFDFARLDEAYANFEQAIAADPDFAFAHLLAGFSANNTESFVAHLGHAIERAPAANEFERLAIQAAEALNRGDDNAAKAHLGELSSKYASNPRSWYLGALVLYNTGNTAEFRRLLQGAIDTDPDFVPAYMYLAESFTLSQPQDPARAEALLRHAIELEPRESYVHDLLGDAVRLQGRLEEAAAAYTTAAELDPTKGSPLQQRGHVNSFLGRYAEARADYDAAVALETGNYKALYGEYRAFVHLHEGNPRGAIDETKRLFAAIDGMNIPDPEGVKINVLVGHKAIAAHHGMLDEYERADELESEIRRARMARITQADFRRVEEQALMINSGFLAAERGNYDEARRIAARYMEMRAAESATRKNEAAHSLLGTVAFKQKNYDEAITHLEQDSPENEYSWYLRARALEALGRNAEAKALYQRIADLYLNSPSVALIRNEVLAKVAALN